MEETPVASSEKPEAHQNGAPATKAGAPPERAATPEPSYVPDDAERARLDSMMKITDRVREEDQQVAAYLEQTVPLRADGKILELGLEKGHVFEKQITDATTKARLENALLNVWGDGAELIFTVGSPDAKPERTVSAERARLRRLRELAAIEEVKNHPRVKDAIEIFRAHVKNVIVAEIT